MKKFCDCSKVKVFPIDSTIAKSIIIKNHYSHRWTLCKYAFGVYYNGLLRGCVVYGCPVGRLTVNSICKTYPLNTKNTLELTRLWIEDGLGSNIESFSIGQTFKLLKKKDIKVIISYSDIEQGHLGIIYQATNFLYQGTDIGKGGKNDYFYKGEWVHARTIYDIFGTSNVKKLNEIDSSIKWKPTSLKHRYIYILDKKDKKKILKDLKHPVKKYPKKS
jgi:hypothetical protein